MEGGIGAWGSERGTSAVACTACPAGVKYTVGVDEGKKWGGCKRSGEGALRCWGGGMEGVCRAVRHSYTVQQTYWG